MKIKTRFAPSPTGCFHLGSARTALYSWLFARHHNGNFVLRIEDTDLNRSTPKAIRTIIDGMNWLGLTWDEGPYFQTKRLGRYREVIDEMLKTGIAYKCFCSKKRLETLRKKQIEKGEKPRYDGYCRYSRKYYSKEEKEEFVVRFANPKEGSVFFDDQIHGLIEFKNQELDDLIICRVDGSPTYNFCVVIDDLDMEITHVIRGEDHISNTPRQINILKALNIPIPIYAHVSMINDHDGKKLSKRYGAINVMQYRNDGYLPEALLNYMIRLGWSNGSQEIFSREEMIKLFSLRSISKSASIFDINKLLWLNHHYINALPVEDVALHLKWQMKRENIDTRQGPQLSDLIKLLGRRCKTIKEIVENYRYFYEEFSDFDENAAKKYLHPQSRRSLEMIRNKILIINNWNLEKIRDAIQSTAKELGVQMAKIGMPLRVATTGKEKSPPLDLTIQAIGKNRTLQRINKALDFISENHKILK